MFSYKYLVCNPVGWATLNSAAYTVCLFLSAPSPSLDHSAPSAHRGCTRGCLMASWSHSSACGLGVVSPAANHMPLISRLDMGRKPITGRVCLRNICASSTPLPSFFVFFFLPNHFLKVKMSDSFIPWTTPLLIQQVSVGGKSVPRVVGSQICISGRISQNWGWRDAP